MGLAILVLSLVGCGRGSRMSGDEFAKFTEDSKSVLQAKIKATVDGWHMDKMKRYDLDQTNGTLVFTDESGQKTSCSIQIVGTYSKESQTWLWAWASPWVTEQLKHDSEVVREFGRTNGI